MLPSPAIISGVSLLRYVSKQNVFRRVVVAFLYFRLSTLNVRPVQDPTQLFLCLSFDPRFFSFFTGELICNGFSAT
jgi:hypothetical protein